MDDALILDLRNLRGWFMDLASPQKNLLGMVYGSGFTTKKLIGDGLWIWFHHKKKLIGDGLWIWLHHKKKHDII